jgi:hypothetical protein
MRPETRYRTVTKAIDSYLKGNRSKLCNKRTLSVLVEAYVWCLRDIERIHNEFVQEGLLQEPHKPDLRSGYETYGYHDEESIMNNMMYLSDRWNCPFRIRWLIDGIENNHF